MGKAKAKQATVMVPVAGGLPVEMALGEEGANRVRIEIGTAIRRPGSRYPLSALIDLDGVQARRLADWLDAYAAARGYPAIDVAARRPPPAGKPGAPGRPEPEPEPKRPAAPKRAPRKGGRHS